ncbi:hypothetical protein [Dyadobacter sp. NIV53]|uniref:hypothetical protein n=1 Tax=Dyadobacter sp. NIV53 TaxID=2861765 RepID=UPI001C87FB7F|nr:hypothetical protein [Dyadobacter sp. NIV53]
MKNNQIKPEVILVFKTNLTGENDVKQIASLLNSADGIVKWNVDLSDVDNVLRIEAFQVEAVNIIQLIAAAGYSCEELQD